ncbi:tyrosine-protein phosphatase 69D [Schistocerca nitens]|uniref:tyrosine-protein phosphatase 69D n=1 Tax=Schistocerca nitens TaxID=7011 RepID=UPI00211871FF|nr:tyrosine-protein phosphatase 69D [Schistocerca nitens]
MTENPTPVLQNLFGILVYIFTVTVLPACAEDLKKVEITDIHLTSKRVSACDNATFLCKVHPSNSSVWWEFEDVNISISDDRHIVDRVEDESRLTVICVNMSDAGNYTCFASAGEDEVSQAIYLNVTMPVVVFPGGSGRINVTSSGNVSCIFCGYPMTDVRWFRMDETSYAEMEQFSVNSINYTCTETLLEFESVTRKDNGTYKCMALGPQGDVSGNVTLFVLEKPQVNIDFVKAVGARRIFLNWTVNDGNEPVEEYFIQHMKNGTVQWMFNQEKIGGGNTSYVIKDLEPNTAYFLRLYAKNSIGTSNFYTHPTPVSTLEKDPDFVPEVSVKGVTINSITIGWSLPPAELKDHIHYYHLVLQNNGTTTYRQESISSADQMNVYLFVDLLSDTTYHFKMSACSEYTKQCGNWSNEVYGKTLDGVSGPPANVTVTCQNSGIQGGSVISVSWASPQNPNGKISYYNVSIEGTAMFKNENGVIETLDWKRRVRTVDGKVFTTRFDNNVPPNTNFTVRVSAVTRIRTVGEMAVAHCHTPPTVPDRDKLAHFVWDKVQEQGRWLFKLSMSRISERNGPICCYRVFLVKLEPQQSISQLPSPDKFPISTYEEVHLSKKGGAYIAEMFESDMLSAEVFLGDGHAQQTNYSACLQCVGLRITPTASTMLPTVSSPAGDIPSTVDTVLRVKRSPSVVPDLPQPPPVYDGQLDEGSNYTGFIEVVVYGEGRALLPAYSSYLTTLSPGPGPAALRAEPSQHVLSLVLQLLCALTVIMLVLLLSLCLLQRYTKHVAEAQGVEMTLANSFRHLCRSLRGRHILVSASPPDMAPIAKSDLMQAFIDRHKDSDYGFQHEFELLPDRFADRTTRHSEARENMYKNRYPDIKAYDQTRVRLSQIDSIVGSDYINANFVVGYKERKKFICAQGPMDNTVCDFWRMIWEQHLELILMLTNLEEYSKTKCAKYWPDSMDGEKIFGDISVAHVHEKRYSDYIIRELRMYRTCSGKDREERSIVQYHYLVWKDFMAPEHPSGILKFIKRLNEAYSLEKGPILVHCSAGVGRTGTLVALDSLLLQLQEEGQVAIFNTVCDLRHQRNFLVQSLKQYIFIYRALMEVAQFGDTELEVSELKSAIEKLRQKENGKDRCRMEEDFEKINRVLEDRKSFSVGGGSENRAKNRNEMVIPYDRNRVILTPIPGREHTTYINASFIEGYDNSECFIITQDPLEVTIPDFWRMILEQNVSTLVMLSDLGDGPKKCLRYWPDDEAVYDHVRVKYLDNESCPYYTRRELSVSNIKTDETVVVTQFQYNGWPTVEGEVPEVTRGLIELVDQTQNHQESQGGSAPIVVHCSCGSDRSSMFVALSILVQQLRTEKRVDIFTTTRKLRSQRHGMLQTFAQYEFLHRAIVNYADLHNLVSDET